jgi:hypothetical protein
MNFGPEHGILVFGLKVLRKRAAKFFIFWRISAPVCPLQNERFVYIGGQEGNPRIWAKNYLTCLSIVF